MCTMNSINLHTFIGKNRNLPSSLKLILQNKNNYM